MPLDKRKVKKGLRKKGFKPDDRDHKFYVYYTISGKISIVKTKVSHGSNKDIHDGLVSMMQKQCKLDKKSDFINLINCPLKQGGYEAILKSKGFIS